jgi:hypothetical protein
LPFPRTGHFLVVELDRQRGGTITLQGKSLLRKAGSTMQIQRGLKKDSVHTKFVLGAHPIIEQFIETMRIREIISTYMASDKRMKLGDIVNSWVLDFFRRRPATLH